MRRTTLKLMTLSAIAIPAMIAWSHANSPLRIQPASRLWVSGTSTVRSFECEAKSFDAIVDATVPDAVAAVLSGNKGVNAVLLTVPVAQLDCKNGTMNEHMLKAVKAKEFANIEFRLDSYDLAKAADTNRVTIRGTLTLGGVSKPITLEAIASTGPNGALKVSGKYPLRMTAYGLQPPKLMLGTLKVNELVNVNFDLLLKSQPPDTARVGSDSTKVATTPPAKPEPIVTQARIVIQHTRAVDQRGINVFEPAKHDTIPYTGFKLNFGAAFTQQFQGLQHSNSASPNIVAGVDRNQLITIGHGFNNAVANLYIDAQLAPGIKVAMTSYLSARHHQESWVKDGYLSIDESPIKFKPLQDLMKYVTVRFGHFELNYGDEHFRRTDNGNAMFNPFVGNFIMDAFTTEIGGEVMFRKGSLIAMIGGANGESRGQVTAPDSRSVAWLGKLGFDKKVNKDLRVRLTGSFYAHPQSASGTLYSGDRGGGRYYLVMVNTAGTEKDSAWTGNLQPGFKSEERAQVINPFVKFHGLEFFGNIEWSQGRAVTEPTAREFRQDVAELVYRFHNDRLYVGTRYNVATGRLAGMTQDITVDRTQFGAGWFITPSILLKSEWMQQLYKDFPKTDIRNAGKIKGFMLEGVVSY